MTRRWILPALFLAAACAPAPSFEGPLVLTPDAAHVEAVTAAAERWSGATGLEIVVADGGIPVRFEPRVFNDGRETCGITERDGSRVVELRIATAPAVACLSRTNTRGSSSDATRTLMHEIGHAIEIAWAGVTDEDDLHILGDESALMASPGTGTHIDVDSLILICSSAPCSTFRNEQPPR